MKVSAANLQGFADAHQAGTLERLCDAVIQAHQGPTLVIDRKQALAFVRSRVTLAEQLGLVSEVDLRAFVALEFRSAGRFAADPEVRAALSDPKLPRDFCVLAVCARLRPESWRRIHVSNPPVRKSS